jgi:hypothetical protein
MLKSKSVGKLGTWLKNAQKSALSAMQLRREGMESKSGDASLSAHVNLAASRSASAIMVSVGFFSLRSGSRTSPRLPASASRNCDRVFVHIQADVDDMLLHDPSPMH